MILVCGEALIDLFVGRPSGAGLLSDAVPGGSPFNVAIGIARLGGRVGFLSKVSSDFFGQYLLRRLAEAGVDTSFVVASDRATTLSVVVTAPDGQPQYAFYGEGAADRSLLASELPAVLPDEVSAIAIGSYTLAIDPVAAAIEQLVKRESARRVISIDPNLRPRVIGDVAAWRPRFERLLTHCGVAKASVEDLEHLYGRGADPHAVAADWMARGPRLVVFTRGDSGAIAFHGADVLELPGRKVDVIDTVGAGDTFHGALLVSLEEQRLLAPDAIGGAPPTAIARAVHFAIMASSITCSRQGADLPTRADVEAAMRGSEA
jgi:fructokinase